MDNISEEIFINKICPECDDQLDESRAFEYGTGKFMYECKSNDCDWEYIGAVVPDLLTTDQVAEITHKSARHIRDEWCHPETGILPTLRIPGAKYIYIESHDLNRAIKSGKIRKKKRNP